jgi:hypothetical protein
MLKSYRSWYGGPRYLVLRSSNEPSFVRAAVRRQLCLVHISAGLLRSNLHFVPLSLPFPLPVHFRSLRGCSRYSLVLQFRTLFWHFSVVVIFVICELIGKCTILGNLDLDSLYPLFYYIFVTVVKTRRLQWTALASWLEKGKGVKFWNADTFEYPKWDVKLIQSVSYAVVLERTYMGDLLIVQPEGLLCRCAAR